jgi:hypothetical protein
MKNGDDISAPESSQKFRQKLRSASGMPDGIVSNQKSQFG